MSRRAAAAIAGSLAALLLAALAYVVVGGLPGLLYAGGIATASFFLALKLGVGRWERKSTIIARLRVELEDREQHIAQLRNQLEREADNASAVQAAQKERIEQLEQVRDNLKARLDEERAAFAQFLGELTGGIGDRDGQLEALERELAALVSG